MLNKGPFFGVFSGSALVVSALLLLTFLGSGHAYARDVGRLDTGFGTRGRVIQYVSHELWRGLPTQVLSHGPSGFRIASGYQVFGYTATGDRDPDFASAGELDFSTAPGTTFEPQTVLLDSAGRILVGGTTATERFSATQEWVSVQRYLPDGAPDAAFAEGGAFVSDLGFPPPQPAPGENLNPYPQPFYEHPHVALEPDGLTLDEADRPLLAGSALLKASSSAPGAVLEYQLFNARLTVSGAPDPGFGEAGIELTGLRSMVPMPKGGFPDRRFPSHAFIGTPRHARLIATDSVEDFRGRTLLLLSTSKKIGDTSRDRFTTHLVRLTRRNRFDTSFSKDGKMTLSLPEDVYVSALRAGVGGRILLVGGTVTLADDEIGERLFLSRVTNRGTIDRGFGHRGYMFVGFGPKVPLGEPIVFESGDRAVIALAKIGRDRGFVLARFIVGR